MDYKDEGIPYKTFIEDVISDNYRGYIEKGDLEDSLDLHISQILEIINHIDLNLANLDKPEALNGIIELSKIYCFLYHQYFCNKISIAPYIETISSKKMEYILINLLNPNLDNIGTLDPEGHPVEYQLFSNALSLICILSYFKSDMNEFNGIVSLYPSIYMAFIDETLVSDEIVGKNICVSLINMAFAEASSESNFGFLADQNLCDLFAVFQNRHISENISSSLCLAFLKYLPHDFNHRFFLKAFLQYYGVSYESDDSEKFELEKSVLIHYSKKEIPKNEVVDECGEYSDYSYASSDEDITEETYFYLMSCVRCFLLRDAMCLQNDIFKEFPDLIYFITKAIEYELPLASTKPYVLGVTALTLAEVYKYYDSFDLISMIKVLNPFELCKTIISSKELTGIKHNAFVLLKTLIKISGSFEQMIKTWDNSSNFFLMLHQHLIEGSSATKSSALKFIKAYLKYSPETIQQFLQTNPCAWISQHIEGRNTQIQLTTLKIIMKILLNCVAYPSSRSEFVRNLAKDDIPEILHDILNETENNEIAREIERIIDYACFCEEEDLH